MLWLPSVSRNLSGTALNHTTKLLHCPFKKAAAFWSNDFSKKASVSCFVLINFVIFLVLIYINLSQRTYFLNFKRYHKTHFLFLAYKVCEHGAFLVC